MKFFDIYNQDKKLHPRILGNIKRLFKKPEFILGSYVSIFEKKFAQYCNTKYAIGCGNGTDAIYLAIKSLNLKKNSEVLLPAMTYCSTVFSVIRAGLKPVLVDIDKNNPNISINNLKKKISKKTKLILLVHLYGESCKFHLLKKLIKNKKLFVIEDASQAHGAFDYSSGKRGLKAGSQGDLACFSFYPGKNLGAYGDAGIITTNDKKKYEYIKKLRNLGSEKKSEHEIIGVNSRLDALQALILSEKIKNLDFLNSRRRKIAKTYEKKITNKRIEKLKYSQGCVYHQYVIRTKNIAKLIKHLNKNNIPFGRHYPYPLHKLKALKNIFKNKKFPNSEYLASNGLSIPIDPLLKSNDIKKICSVINKFN